MLFNPELPEAKSETTGEFLAREFQILDEIADSLGLKRFSSFGNNLDVLEDFNGSPEELDELLGPYEQWFDAAEGKQAFEALAGAIKRKHDNAQNLESPQALVEELQDLSKMLSIAIKKGARFRLEMS
jgi:hypothetical protein